MGERTQDGYYEHQFSVMTLDAATAVGGTDTACILWPNIAVDGVVGLTGPAFTAVSTAAAGTIVTLNQPGIYTIEMNIGLAAAGVLNGGISIGATIATFNQSPANFASATSAYVAIGGNATVAADHALVFLSITRRMTRANINGIANRIRFAATAAITLNATNSLARIQYLGRSAGY